MMRSIRIARLLRSAGLALVVSVTFNAGNALAQSTAWDQKAVTDIAVKLAKSLKDLNVTVKKNPDQPVGSPARKAQYQAREDVKMLVTVSQRLAGQLQAGDDMDATLPTYKRLRSLRRDAEDAGKRGNIPAPTLEKVASVQALLDQMAPYYEEAPEAGAPAAAPAPAPTQ
jgi:hypothetical protein